MSVQIYNNTITSHQWLPLPANINDIGKIVVSILKIIDDVSYISDWSFITSIWITSLYRDDNRISSSHQKNKAIDIVINPAYMMPRIAAILHSMFNFNIYLGTFRMVDGVKKENLHIHIDINYDKSVNKVMYEFIDNNIYPFNKKIIDSIMELYGWKFYLKRTISHWATWETAYNYTKKWLLDEYTKKIDYVKAFAESKESLYNEARHINIDLQDIATKGWDLLKAVPYIIGGLFGLFLIKKIGEKENGKSTKEK